MNNSSRLAWHGIDLHVLMTLLFRSWTVLAGGITVVLISLWLTPVQQGYYYTFGSILALQVFFELGMGQVVIQIVAHEAVNLKQDENGCYVGQEESLARLAHLRALLCRWYMPAALFFTVIISGGGFLFFRDGGLPWSQWAVPWLLLVIASAVNLFFSWKLAMVEGFTLVSHIAKLRLHQSIVGYLLMWLGLAIGAGLWVVPFVPVTAAIATAYWLRIGAASNIFSIHSSRVPIQPISWAKDILPFQWRIAISWISGYFILNLFTPLLFKQAGPAEAGRLGLTMTIFNAISTIGMSWVNAKASNFSMLIARRDSSALLALFIGVALRSLAITAALATILVMGVALCNSIGFTLMQRFSTMTVMLCLAWVSVINCIIFTAAVFMRAHKEEPMLAVSVAGGAITGLTAWLFSTHGAASMMFGYALVVTFISLPWTLIILRQYLARHGGDASLFFRSR